MIPSEMPEPEKGVRVGESSLPVSPTLESEDNLEIVSNFMYLLHDGKCFNRDDQQQQEGRQSCIESCMFNKYPRLQYAQEHYQGNCTGVNCTEIHCKQSVALHEHWNICDKSTCLICERTVNLLIDNFCRFVEKKGPKYEAFVKDISKSDLATRKLIVKINVRPLDSL